MRDLNFGSLNSKYQMVQIELQRYCRILCRISNKLWPLVFTTPSSYTFLLNHIFNNFTDTTNLTPYLGVKYNVSLDLLFWRVKFCVICVWLTRECKKKKAKTYFSKWKISDLPLSHVFLAPLSLSLPIIL